MNTWRLLLRGNDKPRDNRRRDAEHKLHLPCFLRVTEDSRRSGVRTMVIRRRNELICTSCRIQISIVMTAFVTSSELCPRRLKCAHARARETREVARWPPLPLPPFARHCCLELLFGFLRVKYGVFGTCAGRVVRAARRFDLTHFLPNSE